MTAVGHPVAGVDYPSTFQAVDEWFRDEVACRAYIRRLRWPTGFCCPDCGVVGEPWEMAVVSFDEVANPLPIPRGKHGVIELTDHLFGSLQESRHRRFTEEIRVYEIHQATGSPLAEEALRRIRQLYGIEAEIRGRAAEERCAARQERSRPIVDALHTWLTIQLGRVSGKSGLAEAIRYALRHWQGLVLFLDEGQLELDTNTIERAIRPIALGRKNALFAGSDGGARHWAIVASLVATAKLNGVEPLAWLTDALERMVSGRTRANELEHLLPWNWKIERLAAVADA